MVAVRRYLRLNRQHCSDKKLKKYVEVSYYLSNQVDN